MTVDLSALTAHQRIGIASTNLLLEAKMRARASYDAFAEFTLRDKDGAAIHQAPLHRVWTAHVEYCWAAGVHPGIFAPWGHGKTTQISIGRTCYEVGRDHNIRAKIICQNDAKAMERTMGCAALLRSPMYGFVFPEVRQPTREEIRAGKPGKWTQHEIYLHRTGFAIDPSIQAAGVLSAGTGGRADFICFDDVVDRKNAIDQPKEREKVLANIEEVWMQRLDDGGRVIYIGTPWHMDDASHHLIKNPAWCFLRCWISADQRRIHLEVHNPPPGYPLPRKTRDDGSLHPAA